MRLPFKIVKNPKLPEMERKLDLKHFFTFKNGHSIYTYKIEDLALISGRYLDQLKATINFMLQYNSSPEQVKAFVSHIQKFAKDAIDNKIDRTEGLMKIHQYAGEMPKLSEYVEDLEKKMWYDLYVMFFVLDTEPELAFTPKQNNLKIEYLETCTEEEKERFFLYLKETTLSLSDTYRNDTLNSLIQQGQNLNLVEFMLNPMKTLNTMSNVQSTPE